MVDVVTCTLAYPGETILKTKELNSRKTDKVDMGIIDNTENLVYDNIKKHEGHGDEIKSID